MNIFSYIKKRFLPIILAASITMPISNTIVYAEESISSDNVADITECTDSAKEVSEEISDDVAEDVSENDSETTFENPSENDSETVFKDVSENDSEATFEDLSENDSEAIPDDVTYEENIVESRIEVVKTNTIDICQINIDYTKDIEIYDGFIPTGEINTVPLNTTIQIETGKSLSAIAVDSEVMDILSMIKELEGNITSGYSIKAKIDINGNISISSISKLGVEQDSTDVTVYELIGKIEKVEIEKVEAEKSEDGIPTNEDSNDTSICQSKCFSGEAEPEEEGCASDDIPDDSAAPDTDDIEALIEDTEETIDEICKEKQ